METQTGTSNILKWVIIVLLVGAISVGLYFVFKPKDDAPPVDGSPKPPGGGLGDTLGGILSGANLGGLVSGWFAKCDPKKPGYDTNGKPRKKCGASNYTVSSCDENKPGYNKNGVLDPSCGGGSGSCDPFTCDEKRPGYNMCGDKGFPCD